ncbi:TonB-dependent receptor [Sphingomonas crocodyli]|uniref:TonB-dependent receptor n=1 Tax=Sphingomonas crocodyli TaxID=1979270 RepID=A0A437M612_9SPHN|nr:TonB-dependent receptor [Sphingomonas crocodyli]RVT92976.1 TonB-dependent receptor [Sphingomonas crocodyli]
MTRKSIRRLLTRTMLAAGAVPLLLPSAAWAQDATAGEIIVTARKRSENLQKVPEQVTVFTADKIENANITNLRGFVDLTPNLIVRETFRSNETFLTMRGISSAQGALPPVAFIVDGVQLGSNDFINQDLMDIQQIEVLRGPQGTLYGQGAIAGAIVVTTKAPGDELEGMIKGTYGNANSYRIAGAVSAPLVKDALYARVSGFYRHTDGLIRSAADGRAVPAYQVYKPGDRINPDKQANVRGQLEYRGDALKVSLRGSYTDGDGSCCFLDIVPLNAAGQINASLIDDVKNPGFRGDLVGTEKTIFRDGSLKIDYDFGPVSLASITGYAEVRQHDFGDGDYTPAAVVAQDLRFDSDVFNQEIRLTSNGKAPFQWIAGGFYQDRQDRQRLIVGAENVTRPQGGVPSGSVLNQNNVTNRHAWALFGQATYDLTEKLTALVGLRYDEDRQNNQNTLATVNTLAKAKFHSLQPKAQLSYKWADGFMTYATYSTGFRSGGFTQTTQFKNETSRNYELGFKGSFLDNMLFVNASAFYIDYRNQQLSFVIATPTAFRRGAVNIPKTNINGFELEVQARPTRQLSITAALGLSDTDVREVAALDPALGDVSGAVGNHSPLVSNFTFNLGANYTAPISDDMDLVFNGDFRRQGGFYFDLQNTLKTRTGDYVNGRIALRTANWTLALWGKNLTDTRRATRVSETGNRLRTPNSPRSYGVEASYNF